MKSFCCYYMSKVFIGILIFLVICVIVAGIILFFYLKRDISSETSTPETPPTSETPPTPEECAKMGVAPCNLDEMKKVKLQCLELGNDLKYCSLKANQRVLDDCIKYSIDGKSCTNETVANTYNQCYDLEITDKCSPEEIQNTLAKCKEYNIPDNVCSSGRIKNYLFSKDNWCIDHGFGDKCSPADVTALQRLCNSKNVEPCSFDNVKQLLPQKITDEIKTRLKL